MKGFTLIEIVMTLFLFTMVATIVFTVVTLANSIYLQKTQSMEVLQNGRVVLDSVSREIRQSRGIVTNLSESISQGKSEIVFQDGHIPLFDSRGSVQAGADYEVFLDEGASDTDEVYEGAFIKLYNPTSPSSGKVGKIAEYDGGSRMVLLEKPIEGLSSYNNLNYIINSNYYYINYFLDSDNKIMRKVFTYYFSGDENLYVPYNGVPPQGETIEKKVLEKILDDIREVGARITRVGEEEAAVRAVILLVGEIIETDIRDSVERLNDIEGSKVSDLTLALGNSEEEDSARVIIWGTEKESLEKAVSKLEEISEEKGLLMIKPLEGLE